MKAHAVIRLELPEERRLNVLFEALKPETRVPPSPRSRVQIRGEGKTLVLNFKAEDTTALRAAINSYLHWIYLTRNILESVDRLQQH